MKNNTIEVSFIISHPDVSPESLTKILNIQPTLSGVKGEMIQGRSKPVKSNFWELSTGPIESVDAAVQIQMMYEHLLPRKDAIRGLLTKYEFSPLLKIILIGNNQPLPSISMETTHLKLFAELNCKFDIPIYLYFKS